MRNTNVWLLTVGALMASFLLSACGSGGKSGNTSGTGGGGNSGAVTTRNAAIRDALKAFGAIPRSTVDVENQAMLAWFRKNPEFVDSGITDQNVWAHCKDHTTVSMINNRQVVDDGTRSGRAQATRQAVDLPSSKTAHVINNYGNGNAGATSKIIAMLKAGGYTVSTSGGSIEELRHPSGDGVFYIDSHGLAKIEDDGKPTYYLMTSDVYDENVELPRNNLQGVKQVVRVEYALQKRSIRCPNAVCLPKSLNEMPCVWPRSGAIRRK